MQSSPEIAEERRGVLLFNLGGPETLADVRPFLFNLFSDPEIIRIRNDSLRRLLAWILAVARQYKSRGLYRQIGGGSPLRKTTAAQAEALSKRLADHGLAVRTYVGMRCWKPSIDDTLSQIVQDRISRLVVLPLFPQFSVTTTGSCLKHFKKILAQMGLCEKIEVSYITKWFDEPLYLESMADLIQEAMKKFSDENRDNIHLLYSAHSIPASYVAEGDPYQKQTEETVALINTRLSNVSPWTLAYQSKVGPVKWLEPSTNNLIKQFGKEGKRLLVVPVSFVSDHIETLQEIDILYRDLAEEFGVTEYFRAQSLNLYPKFIEALATLSMRAFQQQEDTPAICGDHGG